MPFEPEAHGVTLLLINSHAAHQHAGGEYADRRTTCERAAAAFGVLTLRDLRDRGPQVLSGAAESEDGRRARHILTENQRVLDTVEALRRSDFAEVGRLLTASQESMRDDFEITTDHIDLIAETRRARAGALGARMTGGGFGGCVIALVEHRAIRGRRRRGARLDAPPRSPRARRSWRPMPAMAPGG